MMLLLRRKHCNFVNGIFILVSFYWIIRPTTGQQARVTLDRGALVGLKVFPDSARSAVFVFQGVPYARPPVGELRFAAPQFHPGWEGTLQATTFRPICPQLINTIYDEVGDGNIGRPVPLDEDCLFLNIWAPEAALRYGNLPVLVVLTGEEMAYDWPRERANGLDMASEGVIVVSVQYRQNIYGWISIGSTELAGNYGLLDQQMALDWVQHNIAKFGGNPDQVTLLGHGTSGAPCAAAHAIAPALHGNRTAAPQPLFSQLILMSGGDVERALTGREVVIATSKVIIQKLGCHFEKQTREMVNCVRMKSMNDLLRAFESVYEHGNSTMRLGPCLPVVPTRRALRSRPPNMLPTVVGITSNEGAFLQDFWLELGRSGYQAIQAYVNHTILPRILRQLSVDTAVDSNSIESHIADALNWQYFGSEAAVSVLHLLNAMQRLISESFYESPFYNLLEAWGGNNSQSISVLQPSIGDSYHQSETALYAYIYDVGSSSRPSGTVAGTNNVVGTSLDMRGRSNLFGGAAHSSDLPILLGPSLFQQIARRRFTSSEEKLCRKVRNAFVNFLKSGNPTPGRLFDAWQPYTHQRQFIYALGEQPLREKDSMTTAAFERNLPQIEQELLGTGNTNRDGPSLSRSNRNQYGNNDGSRQSSSTNGVDTAIYPGGREKESSTTNYSATNQADSGYISHLKRVHSFWHILLSSMTTPDDGDSSLKGPLSGRARLMEAAADAARYRKGFYAMLGLVVVLLTILSLCVYLLRANGTHSSGGGIIFAGKGGAGRYCL